MRRALVVVAVALAATAASGAQQAPTLDALLSAFSKMPGLEARFVEEKTMALLVKPLVSRGRLFFARPGYLLRRVESPRKADVLVTPSAVHMRSGKQRKTIDLRRLADVGALVQSLVWLLAGDRAALARVYRISHSRADDGGWKLTLTPRSKKLAHLLKSISVTGKGMAVERVLVLEASGDHSVTRILQANPRRRFSAAEKKRLFGIAR